MADGRIGPYRVLGTIGQGGMGEVLLAEDSRLGRHVAIKRLPRSVGCSEERRGRFSREARAIAALQHPNIVALYDIGEEEEQLYLVLEYVDGRPLSALLREGALPLVRASRIALQIADALRAAHRIGIVHRDIKADNILVTADDRVKVLDFGLAKEMGELAPILGRAAWGLTEPGLIVGSVPYMSPEQLLGEEADQRSDIFSFGIVYHEMLLGRRPFARSAPGQAAHALLVDKPEQGGVTLPDQVTELLSRCLARERSERFPDAGALFEDLEGILLEISTSERRARTGEHFSHPSRNPVDFAPDLPPAQSPPVAIAIIPFQSMRPDLASDYLGLALSSAITERLSALRALTVRPSFYTEKYRGQPVDAAAIGKELDVAYLVTGSYYVAPLPRGARDGVERIRISFELARVATGTMLCKRTMSLPADDVLAFPEAVGQEIVRALCVALSPEDAARMARNRPRSAEAYDLYLRSIGLGSDPVQSAAALDMVQASIAKDPDYAPAWVELSRRYNEALINYFGTESDRERAIAAARRALDLDRTLGIAAAQLGNLLVDAGRAEEGTEVMRRGLRESPNVASLHEFLAYAYRFAGCLAEAERELNVADRVDPLRAELGPTLPNVLLYQGKASHFLERLPVATTPMRHFYRGFALVHIGEKDAARRSFDEAIRLDPENQFSLMARAMKAALDGHCEDGIATLREIVQRRSQNRIWDGEVTYKLSQIAAQLGDLDLAAGLFAEAVGQGFFCYPYFESDPLLEPLRASGKVDEALGAACARHLAYRARFFPPASES